MARIGGSLIFATSLCSLAFAAACSAPVGAEDDPAAARGGAALPMNGSNARSALAETVTARSASALSTWLAPADSKLTRSSNGISPIAEEGTESTADVRLALRADQPTLVAERATGVRVRFTLLGATPVDGGISDGLVVYTGGGPGGSHVVERASASGTEDFVLFERAPAVAEVSYRVDVSGVPGLRLVSNVLEFLDARGTPRLRVGSPYTVDRSGAVHEATLAVAGCAVDTSAAAPWGREVVPPGAPECTISVAWNAAENDYPLLVDPAWTATTKAMTVARKAHTATLLGDGRVLIVGGERVTGATTTYLKTAELFDPGTNTFAATASLTAARSHHFAVLLSTGNVLVAGGASASGALASSEIFDTTTPGFSAAGALISARQEALAVLLSSNRVLAAGGMDPSQSSPVLATAELFDSTKGSWSAAESMGFRRTGHYLTAVSSGRALVVGGLETPTIDDTGSSELYTPATNIWSPGPSLASARHYFAGTTFPNLNVLVAGGYDQATQKDITSAELYSAATDTWSSASTLATAREHHTLTAVSNGAAVAAGGVVTPDEVTITSYLKSAELYVSASNKWMPLPDMSIARAWHTATLLEDGRVLVTGGDGPSGATATAEFLALDKNGVACTVGGTCASGFCVDGVCCESACTALCNACSAANTGAANGSCSPTLAGKDPHSDCIDDGSPSCGKNGLCDGSGACGSYAKAPCTPTACAAGTDCTSGFCVDGVCCDGACAGTCEACTAAKKGSGPDGTCGPVKDATDPDKECPTEGTGACAGDSVCVSSACQVTTFGQACAKATCSDAVTAAAPATCGAAGDCTPATTSCSPYRCDSTSAACKTTCTTNADCAPGGTCANGACQLKSNGASCTAAGECTSNACVDGYCCDGPCTGQCEACDIMGMEGTCTGISGVPHGTRQSCTGSGQCGGSCKASNRMTCSYPTENVSCGPPGCLNGSATTNGCNGIGSCSAILGAPCAPYACGASACKTSCTTDADCDSSGHCNKSGVCVETGTTACSNDETLEKPDGGTKSCGAYLCASGACTTTCTTNTDCAKGATCSNGKCNLPSGGSGGCGCRIGARDPMNAPRPNLPAGAAVSLGLAFLARRGHRHRKRTPGPDRNMK